MNMKRRTFLKSAGIALVLPQLESFGQVADSAEPVKRLLTIVNHLGFYQPELIPAANGAFASAPSLLSHFSKHFAHLKVVSGLGNPGVQLGLGHTPCVGILSGYFNKLERKNRISVDQAVADLIGNETRFHSLVFQAGENLNFSQVSWDKHGLPVRQLDSPRKIFNLLFQVNENEAEQKRVLAEDRSILDVVFRQAKSMEKHLNSRDREKVDEYLTSVREVEKSVRRQTYWSDQPKPKTDYELPEFAPNSVESYVQVMLDLALLALETDSTRALTLQIPFWEGFSHPSISGNYHDFSHHGKKPEKIEKLLVMENAILSRIDRTLNSMKERRVGRESLFDQTTTFVTVSMGNASAHTFDDLPALVFDSRIKNPGHQRLEGVPMCNVYLSLLRHFGAELDRFGESAGTADLFA
jgi:hypothetical protein